MKRGGNPVFRIFILLVLTLVGVWGNYCRRDAERKMEGQREKE